jgi:hypothetical protein
MPASEAQILANQANAQMSTGPTSALGKSISRKNGFKHGMSGQGIVMPVADLQEIDRRVDALEADMRPCSPASQDLIRRMATLSFQMEVTTRHQFAATAMNVRHAADDFDEARLDEADALFDLLGENPRKNLRKLRKSPEGVDRLVDGWTDLRADLTRDPKPYWTAGHLEQAANMIGLSIDHARNTSLGVLARGVWGDFAGLDDSRGGRLDELARQGWSKDRLVERIDVEIAALEEHRLTLDFETIELDRAEAGERALFNTSKEAILARRYDSEAQRNYFKALKEFRQVEAECIERAASDPTPPPTPKSASELGSCRQPMTPIPAEFDPAVKQARWAKMISDTVAGIDLI